MDIIECDRSTDCSYRAKESSGKGNRGSIYLWVALPLSLSLCLYCDSAGSRGTLANVLVAEVVASINENKFQC